MERIIVIGCPGAGKSTFARKLRDVTGIGLYYLDRFWHKEDRTNFSEEEFDCKLEEVLKKDRWIIDGNYLRTLEMRIEKCDTVFFFDIGVDECIAGVESRIGCIREDMPWVEESFDPEFRQWIMDFPKDQLPQIKDTLESFGNDKKIVVFHSREEADEYIRKKMKK